MKRNFHFGETYRKLCSVSHLSSLSLNVTNSSPAKKGVRAEVSPVRRASPRKKPVRCLNKENFPSPQKSPRRPAGMVDKRGLWFIYLKKKKKNLSHTFICLSIVLFFFLDSPTKSPRKSQFKPSMVTSSFYGKQKSIYLTPLERKAIKESLPSPPLPSPPSQENKKNKKNGKAGRKPGKVAAGSRNAEKMGIRYTTSARTIKLSKLHSRFVSRQVTDCKTAVLIFLQLSDISL